MLGHRGVISGPSPPYLRVLIQKYSPLNIGDIICFEAEDVKRRPHLYGYRNEEAQIGIEGHIMGIYAYKSIHLPQADGRLQTELQTDLDFQFQPIGDKTVRENHHWL